MHFQFLIEDGSGEVLIEHVMAKLEREGCRFTFDTKAFKGIGGFKNTCKIKDIKTNKLLNDLPIYLKAFDRYFCGYEACIVIVLDNDDRDKIEFEKQLKKLAKEAGISVDHVFCIAVEEMEAWLLGDRAALFKAYPEARENKYREYEQDSICGTWECLADTVYRGGLSKFKRACPTYREIGKFKAEWAGNIGVYMDLDRNLSPSFNYLIQELRRRMHIA